MQSDRKINVFPFGVQNRPEQERYFPLHGVEVGGDVRQFLAWQQLCRAFAAPCLRKTLRPIKAKICEKQMRIPKDIHKRPDGIKKAQVRGSDNTASACGWLHGIFLPIAADQNTQMTTGCPEMGSLFFR